MTNNNMNYLQKRTRELAEGFSSLHEKEPLFIDLVEEVGELATALLYLEGHKQGRKNGQISVDDVKDSLADILWQLFRIADAYDADLLEEYEKMMERLRERIKNQEFKQ